MARRLVLPALFLSALAFVPLQDEPPAVDVVPVSGNVSMLVGAGGNVGVSIGDDGVLLVDDQFGYMTEGLLGAVATLTTEPVRYLVNTHWHSDHTGGNENMAGEGVVLVAHDNVRRRMSTDQAVGSPPRTFPASPAVALPRITFDREVTFHWNGDVVYAFHVPNAHTDGDTIIHFEAADVLHMGDTFFNGFYPFIDTSSGGGIDGLIAAADAALERCGDDTRIIPGHGDVGTRDDLRDYRDMLVDARSRIAPLVERGLTLEQVITESPTEHLDERWGGGFMNPMQFTAVVYDSLTADR